MTNSQEWMYWLLKRHYGSAVAIEYLIFIRREKAAPVPKDYEPPF